MVKSLLSIAWAFNAGLNKSIFGRDWGGVQYALCAVFASILSVLFGFGAGIAFGLAMVGVAVLDSEILEGAITHAERDPLLMRAAIYAYATLVVTVPLTLASMAALDVEHWLIAHSFSSGAFLHEAGWLAKGVFGDLIAFVLGTCIFLCLDTSLLAFATDRLGYAVDSNGNVVHK